MNTSRSAVQRHVAVVLAATAAIVATPGVASAIERPATPATLNAVWSTAQSGDTVLLAAGDYGMFRGGHKTGTVTIRPQPGALARMQLDFRNASNITIDGVMLGDVSMQDDTKNVTVRNSTISGQTILRTGTLANANILFDSNHHTAWDKCGDCAEGRVFLPERTQQPSGITIQNSKFGPGGNSDGIQNGSNGTRILNNEFTGIRQIDGDDVHADSIQLYGSKNTVIAGNYFHGVSVGIMCADGCDHETVEDNIFDVDGSPYAVTWLSDDGSVIRHNTFVGEGICDYNQRCGVLYLGNKDRDPVSRGTIVKDNILTRICVCDGEVSGLAVEDYNLLRQGGSGANDLRGAPSFVGGANPSSRSGFLLTAGSIGAGSASDGTDRGARATAPLSLPSEASPGAPAVRIRSTLRGAIATGRLRLAVRTQRAGSLSLRVTIRVRKRGHHGRSRTVRLRSKKVGWRRAGTHKVSVMLPRTVRRLLRGSSNVGVSVRFTVGSRSQTVSGLTLAR